MAEQTEAEKLGSALREFKPSWDDGQGVRGPQNTVKQAPSQDVERRSDAPRGEIVRQPQATSGGGTVDDSKDTETDVADVYGAQNGAPALFHFIQDSPPTQPPP